MPTNTTARIDREEPEAMNTATSRRIVTQRAEDLHRLADQAERRGIRILLTADGEHFATSTSNPTSLHRVSEQSCDCKGFAYWGRCQHHSLLLAELGRLPDLEPVIAEMMIAAEIVMAERRAPCRSCRGTGFVRMTTGPALADWVMAPCTKCPGQPAPSPRPVAVCAA